MNKFLLAALLFPTGFFAQGYTSYFTGSNTDISTTTEFGLCMMGGATEHDNAMIWLLQKANGGDVVVLRSSGGSGYNNYLYSQLGVTVNSVETLVITSEAGATNPYVLDKIAKAEMIWFAGGDQYNYVSFFKDNALEDLINEHINVKHAPIGGTSAGMAILGSKYFSAQNGSINSADAMANPYSPYITIGSDDFLEVPFMHNVITDTHYDYYDRRGRQTAFMARLQHDGFGNVNGIACNEYVAVCIGQDGLAHVYGDYPNFQEFAYFLQPNCAYFESAAEVCMPNTPLTWNHDGQAVKVYKVAGTMNGVNYFDVNDWTAGIAAGGSWENWSVVNGVLQTVPGTSPECILKKVGFNGSEQAVSPNPFQDFIEISSAEKVRVSIFNTMGKTVYNADLSANTRINTIAFTKGFYIIKIESAQSSTFKKLIKN